MAFWGPKWGRLKNYCSKLIFSCWNNRRTCYMLAHSKGPFILRRNCVALLHCTLLHRNCDATAVRRPMKVTFILTWTAVKLWWLAAESNWHISAPQCNCSVVWMDFNPDCVFWSWQRAKHNSIRESPCQNPCATCLHTLKVRSYHTAIALHISIRHVNATRSYLHFRQNWVFYW